MTVAPDGTEPGVAEDRERLRTELADTLVAAPSYYSRREAVEIVDALLPVFGPHLAALARARDLAHRMRHEDALVLNDDTQATRRAAARILAALDGTGADRG